MKKFLTAILALVLVTVFSGCSFLNNEKDEQESVEEEKVKELEEKISNLENQIAEKEGPPEEVDTTKTEPKVEEVKQEPKKEEPKEEEPKPAPYEGPNFIKLTSPANNAGLSKQPAVFTGEASPNTTKIIVTASSEGPDGPVKYNTYQLQSFKEGDKNFKYSARIDWGNLKSGQNYYEFKAFFNDETTKIENIAINFYVGENTLFISQPSSDQGFMTEPIEFKGTLSPNVKKIVAKAWRSAGEYSRFGFGPYSYDGYQDTYTLQNFKAGDSSFVYKAGLNFGNLSAGPNNYEFTAYYDDGNTKTVGVYNIWYGVDQN